MLIANAAHYSSVANHDLRFPDGLDDELPLRLEIDEKAGDQQPVIGHCIMTGKVPG